MGYPLLHELVNCISRNIDSDFNLVIWQSRKDCQINSHHYQSIYTTSMGYSPYSNEICQFKIPSPAFSEQTAKYNVCLCFRLYSTYVLCVINIISLYMCCLVFPVCHQNYVTSN